MSAPEDLRAVAEGRKPCRDCRIEKPLTGFRKDAKGRLGCASVCKECRDAADRARIAADPLAHQERKQAWRATNRDKMRASDAKWRKANPGTIKAKRRPVETPEAKRARQLVGRAILAGRLVRPESCERCGSNKHKVYGHHHDYSKPLDVEWLCASCHREEHLEVA